METAPPPSRRDVLKVSAAVLGGAAVAGPLAGTAAASEATLSRARIATPDLSLHLLRRATYGPTPSLLASVRKLGREKWLERQLNPAEIDDGVCDALMTERFPGMAWTITEARANLEEFSWDLMRDLGLATVARAVWSKRQLFEVMCDFWSNHLNVTNPYDNGWANRHDYDRRVIRRHALGRFDQMLVASAKHPAMLYYLNNADSTKDNPNENYGRELLELHSVSVDGGYDEEDMRQSTLIMTGFGVDWETGLFQYNDWAHYQGSVKVLGFRDANASADGYDMGIRYVQYLARHPQTAQHLARKLCVRFVSDTPPQYLIDALAKTYLANNTAIKPVLRQLFLSKAFANSVGKKTRRPFEDVTATLRILGYRPELTGTDGVQGLYWMSGDLGQAPLAWSPPDGYPDVASSWRSAGNTVERWNMHMRLAAHWWPRELVQPPLLDLVPSPLPATHGALIDALAQRLVFRKLEPEHRAAILTFLDKSATTPLTANDSAVKWRLSQIVALILDSPYHGIR